MSSNYQKRCYTPQISEVSCISVRRLAWSLEKPMTNTVDFLIQLLPFFFSSDLVCQSCRDSTKCGDCAFFNRKTLEEKQAFLDSL
jgi:hypothetical protein